METLIAFMDDNLSYKLLIIIVLGGIFITKYTEEILMKPTYKVLIASVIVSAIFYVIDGCGAKCLTTYFFTYLFATSFYELIVKFIVKKVKSINE